MSAKVKDVSVVVTAVVADAARKKTKYTSSVGKTASMAIACDSTIESLGAEATITYEDGSTKSATGSVVWMWTQKQRGEGASPTADALAALQHALDNEKSTYTLLAYVETNGRRYTAKLAYSRACDLAAMKKPYSSDEVYLARVIYAEINGGNDREKTAVAWTIKNRMLLVEANKGDSFVTGNFGTKGTVQVVAEHVTSNGQVQYQSAHEKLADGLWGRFDQAAKLNCGECKTVKRCLEIAAGVLKNTKGYEDPYAGTGGGFFFHKNKDGVTKADTATIKALKKQSDFIHYFWTFVLPKKK